MKGTAKRRGICVLLACVAALCAATGAEEPEQADEPVSARSRGRAVGAIPEEEDEQPRVDPAHSQGYAAVEEEPIYASGALSVLDSLPYVEGRLATEGCLSCIPDVDAANEFVMRLEDELGFEVIASVWRYVCRICAPDVCPGPLERAIIIIWRLPPGLSADDALQLTSEQAPEGIFQKKVFTYTPYHLWPPDFPCPASPVFWPFMEDANYDCMINILDMLFIRDRVGEDVSTANNWQADVNKDGEINILDIISVRDRLNETCEDHVPWD